MKRVEFITVKEGQILVVDFSNLKVSEIKPVIEEATERIAQQPNDSILSLTDLTKMGFSSEVLEWMNEFTLHNKPYVKAAAIVGAKGLLDVVRSRVEKKVLRGLVSFESREEALEWLVRQK